MPVDVSLTIGGDAGQGVESSGAGFSQALARAGYHVFSVSDYRSRIRGGHNFYQIRASDREIFSHSDPIDLLLALTEETIAVHAENVRPGGGVIFDEEFGGDAEDLMPDGLRPFRLPLSELAETHGSRIMFNTAAAGAAVAVLDLPQEPFETVIQQSFRVKGSPIIDANLTVFRDAWEVTRQRMKAPVARLPQRRLPTRMVLHGNHAICLGAVAAGCRFSSAYPMTPATSIFEWLTAHGSRLGVVTKHAEDEIAAACMAIGAAQAGARALVPTSGGGFALMTEALGMAGMCEIPVLFVLAQRGGPSTGLPTRTEQGDLLFALHASQGEFPRIVLAPGNRRQCFEAAWRGFNLAERYQTPVILMTDQFLASSRRDLPLDALELGSVTIDRGELLDEEALARQDGPYLRHEVTESGISPRALPGHAQAVYALTTDEHDEEGHITEEMINRRSQMTKRMKKLATAAAELRGPERIGPVDAPLTLITWGSTYGPAIEAVEQMQGEVNMLHFVDLWPFPTPQVEAALAGVRRAVAVEQNYTGQFARLLRMMTGFRVDDTLNKFDGRPFSPGEIVASLRERRPAWV